MKTNNLICTLLLGASLTACNEVDICERVHPHPSSLKFNFNWQENETNIQTPDTIGVLAYRVIGQQKYLCKVNTSNLLIKLQNTKDPNTTPDADNSDNTEPDNQPANSEVAMWRAEADDNNGEGDVQPGEDDNNGDNNGGGEGDNPEPNPEPNPNPETDALSVLPGEYRLFTFPLNNEEVDYSELYAFINGNSSEHPISDVGFTYKEYDVNDPALRKKLTSWDDFNSYAKYVQPDASPLFYDTTQVIKVESDQVVSHTFTPTTISQNIDVYFNIDKNITNTKFVVDDVWAEISGVPRYIKMNSGQLDITKTSKIMFPMDLTTKDNGTEDTDDNTLLKCHGNINVTGIVNVQRSKGDNDDDVLKKIHGPGIMQVIIYGHMVDPVTGTTRYKKWQGIINLYRPIQAADLMQVSIDNKYVTRKRSHGVINITSRLTLDGDKIAGDKEGGSSLGEWIPTVSILLDI